MISPEWQIIAQYVELPWGEEPHYTQSPNILLKILLKAASRNNIVTHVTEPERDYMEIGVPDVEEPEG